MTDKMMHVMNECGFKDSAHPAASQSLLNHLVFDVYAARVSLCFTSRGNTAVFEINEMCRETVRSYATLEHLHSVHVSNYSQFKKLGNLAGLVSIMTGLQIKRIKISAATVRPPLVPVVTLITKKPVSPKNLALYRMFQAQLCRID
jgi:non-canonical (house-cleaning) NTP pyrophosphatase